ncbi:MAG: metallophosphoesterase [Desulfobacula sp.]|uniref:metallophosphoesterase n=1 Tax=Desulfobacula sp. TaxID=2593537 RepID=UPI0025C50E6F|nr:metallophosphoesterase [Desulfobacula sp.]MCD4722574.1 metallophosphoesterase [Desulfobacula sp.]
MRSIKILMISFLVVLFIYGRYIEPNNVKIRTVSFKSAFINKALYKGLVGKKIVHLSDLHISKFGKRETQVLNIIDQINPDLIFLTGDYIKWKGNNKPALKFLSRLEAKQGVYAVMGDYDYSDSKNSCLFCHEKGSGKPTKQHNVILLRNSSQEIKISDQVIQIAGIDEGYDDFGDFKDMDDIADKNSLVLVLSHSPLAFDDFSTKDRIFMFAGDTHGGQVKFPLWLFKLFGYEKNVKYNDGLFQKGNKTMYVTRGIGTSHFRFRLFCPPEIAVIQF